MTIIAFSKTHAQSRGTLKHRVVLRFMPSNSMPYVVHTQIWKQDSEDTYFEKGDYHNDILEAAKQFKVRADRLETRYADFLENDVPADNGGD